MKPAAYGLDRTDITDRELGRILSAFDAETPHDISVDWSPLPTGVTNVEVSDASMFVSPRGAEESVPSANVSPSAGGTFVVALPPGVRVRSLTLGDLGIGVGDAHVSLASQSDLSGHDPSLRLTVALPDPRGGFAAPTFAVPAVGGSAGVTPNSLTGASYENGVLTLPEVAAAKLRLAVVTGDPGSFSTAPDVSLSKVAAVTARYPTGLTLSDESGATLWGFPKEMPPRSASQPVDFKPGLKKTLLDKVKAGTAPAVHLKLDAPSSAAVTIAGLRIKGTLVRPVPGTVRTSVAGAATPVALVKRGEPPLVVDDTTTIAADVTVRYDGIRIVSDLSDRVPGGANSGIVIGADGARAPLPPAADVLKTLALARVGIIGRAPEACELSVRLVRQLSGHPLPGDPAVMQLDAAGTVSVIWFALSSPLQSNEPIAVAARATRGRFLWAADAQGKPLVQIAVADPNPPDRTVTLGGRVIVNDLTPAHRPAVALTASFRSTAKPVFESAMFVTIDLSDVTVRYAR